MATQEFSAIELVQNPAFGAVLLWHSAKAYQAERIGELPQLPLFFLALPILYHGPTLVEVRSTHVASGLSKLAFKLDENRERLFAVHDRALLMRELSLQSVATGVSTGLLSINYASAQVRANDTTPKAPPERLRGHVSGAGKLGHWFARLPPSQVFSLLKVEV